MLSIEEEKDEVNPNNEILVQEQNRRNVIQSLNHRSN